MPLGIIIGQLAKMCIANKVLFLTAQLAIFVDSSKQTENYFMSAKIGSSFFRYLLILNKNILLLDTALVVPSVGLEVSAPSEFCI